MDIGPITMQGILDETEKLGDKLGIPRGEAVVYVQTAYTKKLADNIDRFQEEAVRWRKEQEDKERKRFDWKKFAQKSFAYIAGILKSEE